MRTAADVVLRSAAALSAARRAATGHQHVEHVNRSTIAICAPPVRSLSPSSAPDDAPVLAGYVALWRYDELASHAKTNGIAWPLEPTIEETFQSLSKAVALTEACYGKFGGKPFTLPLAEGHSLNMTVLRSMLVGFKACPAGWKRPAGEGCLPVCSGGASGRRILPTKAAASSIFDAGRGFACNDNQRMMPGVIRTIT